MKNRWPRICFLILIQRFCRSSPLFLVLVLTRLGSLSPTMSSSPSWPARGGRNPRRAPCCLPSCNSYLFECILPEYAFVRTFDSAETGKIEESKFRQILKTKTVPESDVQEMLDGGKVHPILTLLSPFAAEYHKLSIPVEDSQSQEGALGQIYYRGKYKHHINYMCSHFFQSLLLCCSCRKYE